MKNFLLKATYSIQYLFVTADLLVMLSLYLNRDNLTPIAVFAHLYVIALTCHQMEESRFPGGFVWMFNTFQKSDDLHVYPMNRLSWFMVDGTALVLFTLVALFHPTPMIVLAMAIFGLLENITHGLIGTIFLKRFTDKGKETIYTPGSMTCWFLFLPLSCLIIAEIARQSLLTPLGVLGSVLITVAFFLIVVQLPERALADKNSFYRFKRVDPGYFSKYLD